MSEAKLGKTQYSMSQDQAGIIEVKRVEKNGKVTRMFFPRELLSKFAQEQMAMKVFI